MSISELKQANERTVASFYEALGALDQTSGQERLAELLAPDFTEQRLDIQQTMSREAFLRAALQEARTFPDRKLVPTSIAGDRGWAVVMVQTVDAGPGKLRDDSATRLHARATRAAPFRGWTDCRPRRARRDRLAASIAGRQCRLDMEGFGSQTIKIARRRLCLPRE